jgi:hypothetical protein
MSLLFVPFLLVLLLGIAATVVWIWALVDCIQVPDDSMYRSGTKLIWVLVIVFATFIGSIVYLAIGRPDGTRPRVERAGAMPPPPPPV